MAIRFFNHVGYMINLPGNASANNSACYPRQDTELSNISRFLFSIMAGIALFRRAKFFRRVR
ncbi:hypothetical protein [Crenothrix sp.]|uniref:hypothetical protein n=1 Tax=Crenothrix sp. TaxID=3100433 RepID=UPI00374CDE96